MAAISDNKYDVYKWIIKVIDSCETLDHINSAERLVERFKVQSRDIDLHFTLYHKISIKVKFMKDEQSR
tara:strand:- start:149 stop:355 length:207 start_codon:yes stop_codon:yes gene_type:complete